MGKKNGLPQCKNVCAITGVKVLVWECRGSWTLRWGMVRVFWRKVWGKKITTKWLEKVSLFPSKKKKPKCFVLTKCLSSNQRHRTPGCGRESWFPVLGGNGGLSPLGLLSMLSMGVGKHYQDRPHLFLKLWKNTRVINLQGPWKTL